MTKLGSDTSAPWHMWVVGGLLLLWNGLGAFDYVATVIRFEPHLAGFPEETLSYYFDAPLWMFAMWGIASFGGLIGAILLLMRRSAALPVFGIAWLCSVIAVAYGIVNPAPGIGDTTLFMAIVIIVALLILLYMYWLQRRGVLR